MKHTTHTCRNLLEYGLHRRVYVHAEQEGSAETAQEEVQVDQEVVEKQTTEAERNLQIQVQDKAVKQESDQRGAAHLQEVQSSGNPDYVDVYEAHSNDKDQDQKPVDAKDTVLDIYRDRTHALLQDRSYTDHSVPLDPAAKERLKREEDKIDVKGVHTLAEESMAQFEGRGEVLSYQSSNETPDQKGEREEKRAAYMFTVDWLNNKSDSVLNLLNKQAYGFKGVIENNREIFGLTQDQKLIDTEVRRTMDYFFLLAKDVALAWEPKLKAADIKDPAKSEQYKKEMWNDLGKVIGGHVGRLNFGSRALHDYKQDTDLGTLLGDKYKTLDAAGQAKAKEAFSRFDAKRQEMLTWLGQQGVEAPRTAPAPTPQNAATIETRRIEASLLKSNMSTNMNKWADLYQDPRSTIDKPVDKPQEVTDGRIGEALKLAPWQMTMKGNELIVSLDPTALKSAMEGGAKLNWAVANGSAIDYEKYADELLPYMEDYIKSTYKKDGVTIDTRLDPEHHSIIVSNGAALLDQVGEYSVNYFDQLDKVGDPKMKTLLMLRESFQGTDIKVLSDIEVAGSVYSINVSGPGDIEILASIVNKLNGASKPRNININGAQVPFPISDFSFDAKNFMVDKNSDGTFRIRLNVVELNRYFDANSRENLLKSSLGIK